MDKQERTTSDVKPHEDGWTWVNQRTNKKDSATVKDYSEDIDSLFVLDGLFSAVVTGFVVVAITMLQEDTGQTSVELLSTISAQLSSLTITSPYINSTSNGPPIQPFRPTSAARWINSLWFISLILSLASAVVGILAKQWIREYLQWDSQTSASRENVLVREIRAEAWKEWYTTSIISAVPVLLEVAIILFTCGMAVFVWTLDLVVAVVVTICVGLFLLLIATLTLLPAICKHCPYKSPTAWAVGRLLRWLVGLYRHLANVLIYSSETAAPSTSASPIVCLFNNHFGTIHSIPYLRPETLLSWRSRDLQGAQLRKLRDSQGSITESQSILLEELQLELRGAAHSIGLHFGDHSASRTPNSGARLSSAVLRAYITAVSEADLLFKALVLAVMELPSSDALRYVTQCVQSMHPPLNCMASPDYIGLSTEVHLAEVTLDGAFRNLSMWYMLSRLDSTGPGYMGSLTRHPSVTLTRTRGRSTIVASIINTLRGCILDEQPRRDITCTFLPPEEGSSARKTEYEESPLHNSQHIVTSYALVYSLQELISQMLHSTILDLSAQHPVVELLHRRADEILCALRLVTFYWDSASALRRTCRRDCAQVLVEISNGIVQNPLKRKFDISFSTLRTQLFLMLAMSQYPIRRSSQHTLELEQVSEEISSPPKHWLTFAMQHSGADLDLTKMSEEDVSIFAQVVNQALGEVHHYLPQDVEKLCQIMISALTQVGSGHCEEALRTLHETWIGQLIQDKALGDDNEQIVLVMLERSASSLLCLLQALQVDECDADGTLARYLVGVLLVVHRIPLEPAKPKPALKVPDALQCSTILLKEWPSDVGEYAQQWHHQFVWAGGHWIREIGRRLSPSAPQDTNSFTRDFPDVLRKMTEATQRAEQHGWQNRGQGSAVVPWLEDLFSTSLEETNHPQHDTESSTTVDVLFRHAPDAFGSLIDAFERIAEAHQFRSPLLDKLCLTRRQYAASIPEQIVAQGQ